MYQLSRLYLSILKNFGEDNLPEWLVNEMAANKQAAKRAKFETLLLSRRALEPGTEITTDYSRWHWSNADYNYGNSRKTPIGFFLGDANRKRWDWNELSPKIQRAAQILGYTEALWESGKTPFTFEKSWNNLSLQEQEAVVNLTGHNKKSWNEEKGFDPEDDSSKSIGVLDEVEWDKLSEDQKNYHTSWRFFFYICVAFWKLKVIITVVFVVYIVFKSFL